jgi:fluoroquinolone resistance protein
MRDRILSAEFIEHEQFTGLDFTDSVLTGKELADCVFDRCVFNQTDLSRSRFENVCFSNCSLSNCVTENTQFFDIRFEHSKIVGFTVCTCNQPVADFVFTDCKIMIGNFTGAHMKGVRFTSCVIEESYFQHTCLREADFSGTQFIKTLFDQCDLRKADFTRATGYEIDPRSNTIEKGIFSLPDVLGLLDPFGIKIQ